MFDIVILSCKPEIQVVLPGENRLWDVPCFGAYSERRPMAGLTRLSYTAC